MFIALADQCRGGAEIHADLPLGVGIVMIPGRTRANPEHDRAHTVHVFAASVRMEAH